MIYSLGLIENAITPMKHGELSDHLKLDTEIKAYDSFLLI